VISFLVDRKSGLNLTRDRTRDHLLTTYLNFCPTWAAPSFTVAAHNDTSVTALRPEKTG
jgi:hypothetical protein